MRRAPRSPRERATRRSPPRMERGHRAHTIRARSQDGAAPCTRGLQGKRHATRNHGGRTPPESKQECCVRASRVARVARALGGESQPSGRVRARQELPSLSRKRQGWTRAEARRSARALLERGLRARSRRSRCRSSGTSWSCGAETGARPRTRACRSRTRAASGSRASERDDAESRSWRSSLVRPASRTIACAPRGSKRRHGGIDRRANCPDFRATPPGASLPSP